MAQPRKLRAGPPDTNDTNVEGLPNDCRAKLARGRSLFEKGHLGTLPHLFTEVSEVRPVEWGGEAQENAECLLAPGLERRTTAGALRPHVLFTTPRAGEGVGGECQLANLHTAKFAVPSFKKIYIAGRRLLQLVDFSASRSSRE